MTHSMTHDPGLLIQRQSSFWLRVGAISAMLMVALGAFGAHALRADMDDRALEVYRTAVQYHAIHALAILVCGVAMRFGHLRRLRLAAWLFLAGIILFSGSLYLLAVFDVRWLGAVTPFGGLAFLGGWVMLAFAVPFDVHTSKGN